MKMWTCSRLPRKKARATTTPSSTVSRLRCAAIRACCAGCSATCWKTRNATASRLSKCASPAPGTTRKWRSATTARAFPRPSASACSTRSTAAREPRTSPARDWGLRWCGKSQDGTAATRAARRRAGGAPALSWPCRQLLVFTQLNMPKTCYPVPQKEVQDGKVKGVTVASADARRAPDIGGQAQRLVALGEAAPAVPDHRRGAQRPQRRGCGRSSWLPFYGRVRLGASVQPEQLCELRASAQPQGPAADSQGRATAGTRRCSTLQPAGAGVALFDLVGGQARRVLPGETLTAGGDR